MEKQKSGMATAGLVLGIIGICTSFIPIVNNASFVLGVLAFIFGLISIIKKKGVGKAVAGLILGVLAVVITLYMQSQFVAAVDDAFSDLGDEMGYLSGEKTDEILENSLDVVFGEFSVEENEFLDETKLTAKVTNKSDEKKSFSITVEAVNAEGNRITTDYIYATDLNGGQSQDFEIFTLVSSDMIEALKTATFKIVEVSAY